MEIEMANLAVVGVDRIYSLFTSILDSFFVSLFFHIYDASSECETFW